MSYGFIAIRRFNVKANGRAYNRVLRKRLELPLPPAVGLELRFAAGGPAVIQKVGVQADAAPALGIPPERIEVLCRVEPEESLAAALAEGWLPMDDPAPDAAGHPPANTTA